MTRLVLTTLAALALGLPATAQAAKGLEVAVEDENVFVNGTAYNSDKGYANLGAMNVSWMRILITWNGALASGAKSRTAPKSPKYLWTAYDNAIKANAARGIQTQLTLTGAAPAWATSNKKVGNVGIDQRKWKAFVKAAAQHFEGDVTRYSVWNEPNYQSWLPQATAPTVYRSLYKNAYSAIKGVDRDAQVLIGELAPYNQRGNATAPLAFLRNLFGVNAAGRPVGETTALKADGFAHHPYDLDHGPTYKYPGADNVTIGTLSRLTSFLDRLQARRLLTTPAGGKLQLYLTEFGYLATGKRAFPAATRARYLVQGFQIAQKNPRVEQLLQYLLASPGRSSVFNTAIMDGDGDPFATYDELVDWTAAQAKTGGIAEPK